MRLINAEDVKELLIGLDSLPWEEEVDDLVDRLATVEAKPVVYGEWLPMHFGGVWMCSNCKTLTYTNKATKFCSECGADMRKNVK